MYQPYPARGQPPAQAPRQPPGSVRTAALLMYAGAAVSLVNAVVVATTIASYRAAIHRSFPRYSPAQVHAVASAGVVFTVVLAIVEIFFWLWLAWACRAGRNWGRITGTVLFGLNTLLLLVPLLGRANAGVVPRATVGTLLTVLVWLAGLGAVIMLWLPASSAYFTGAWRE